MASTVGCSNVGLLVLSTVQPSLVKDNSGLRSARAVSTAPRKAGVRCEARSEDDSAAAAPLIGGSASRRQTLFGLSSAALAAGVLSPVTGDSGEAHAADLIERIQRGNYLTLVQGKLRRAVSANPEIAPALLKLGLNDAATYDPVSKTGGANGSIHFSEELSRPENKGLDVAVKFLEGVKADIDAETVKNGPISWADLIALAAQAGAKRLFYEDALVKTGGDVSKATQISQSFGSASQWGLFEKRFGRTDATEADPAGRVPDWPNASIGDIKTRLGELGIKPYVVVSLAPAFGDRTAIYAKLAQDPELAQYVNKYEKSRKTISQTDFEVDLIVQYSKLALLGQAINFEAYSYAPPPVQWKL